MDNGTSCVAGARFSRLIAGGGCTLPSGLEMASASCPLSLLLERRLRRGGLELRCDLPELPDLVAIAGGGCTLPSGLERASAAWPLSLLLERRLRRGGVVLLCSLPELPDLALRILGICKKQL